MGTKEEKDEMEGVESISPEQAKKEMREAVKHVHEEESKQGGSSKRSGSTSKRSGSTRGDEMEDVETITPEQARKEMREAAQRVRRQEEKKKK